MSEPGISLKARLRTMHLSGWNPIGKEALDRIEELEAALERHRTDCPQCCGEGVFEAWSLDGEPIGKMDCDRCAPTRALLNKEKKE